VGAAKARVVVNRARVSTEKHRFIYLISRGLLLVYIYIVPGVPALNWVRRIEIEVE
jgi:hypothetical protein